MSELRMLLESAVDRLDSKWFREMTEERIEASGRSAGRTDEQTEAMKIGYNTGLDNALITIKYVLEETK